ncbi:MAG TPA: zinc carboxypeptidase [Microscillaceae bacterium]|nr:zinc carboxypeptidase [Microscillaceae bacterium]
MLGISPKMSRIFNSVQSKLYYICFKKDYMRKLFLVWITSFLSIFSALAQNNLQTPSKFLGYDMGSRFTFHHRVVDYVQHLAKNSPRVRYMQYGATNEGRPLVLTLISSPENLKNWQQIQQNNLIATGFQKGTIKGKHIPIIWLSYNVHGDEASCTEAALITLHKLAAAKETNIQNWLKDLIIVVDPCVNPDGRERYVNWYNQVGSLIPNPSLNGWEHHQGWARGRFNHYMFDLNRDWAWQTQIESQQRLKVYQQWMPHIHVDFHEMSYNNSYFFAPAAKPYHQDITSWQRKFQEHLGANHARYFNQNKWLYFTQQVYDLLYPSYGDTWPMFNGAMGFTYEQAGSGYAGVSVKRSNGDTLTLKDRFTHHVTTGLSTIEITHKHRQKILDKFKKYFKDAVDNPPGEYKTYVIKNQRKKSKVKALLTLLDKQKIQYEMAGDENKRYNGFDYLNKRKDASFRVQKNDILISAYQPKSVLVKVLLEPETFLEDSLTYDLTAWSLPYIYNMEAYACKERINGQKASEAASTYRSPSPNASAQPYAFISKWDDFESVRFLSALLRENILVRFGTSPFQINQQKFKRGTLVILSADNKRQKDLTSRISTIARKFNVQLTSVNTGIVEKGQDLGTQSYHRVKKPKIAVLAGDNIYNTAFGEIWHYMEKEIRYPITVINTRYLDETDLYKFDIIILPSGNYAEIDENFIGFVKQGGKIIALENALRELKRDKRLLLNRGSFKKNKSKRKRNNITRYYGQSRQRLMNRVAGAIYKVSLDNTHPLAYGEDQFTFLIKRNSRVYPYLPRGGWNVGRFENSSHISGFVGTNLKERIDQTLALGVEPFGKGQIVYMSDSPIFRGFWYSGKLLFGNALFFVGN